MKYLTSKEVAILMGVNVSTIKRWTDDGKLPCYQTPGGHRKFILSHINEFLSKNKKKSRKVNVIELEGIKDRKLIQYIDHGAYQKLIPVFLDHAINADSNRLKTTLIGLYMKQYPVYEIYDSLVLPVLRLIGDKWADDKISIAEEHLASNTIRNAVNALGESLQRQYLKGQEYTLCLALSGDQHDLPLIMAKQVLELQGIPVLNCGRDTPVESLKTLLKKFKPDRIIVSLTYIEDRKLANREMNELFKITSELKVKIGIGGQGIHHISGKHRKNAQLLKSIRDITQI